MRRVIIKGQDQIIILRTWLILLITKSPLIHSYEGLALEACCFLMYAVLFVLITLLTQMKKKDRTIFYLINRSVYRRFFQS